jgi:8-oxo-dGTP pyrophosphatase MutT (NUDIX family)
MAERFKLIAEVCILFVKDGKVLLLRRQNTGWNDGWYCTPAGHVEEGESMKEAAAREAGEEVGVSIDPKDLEFVHVQHRWSPDNGGHSRIGFYFEARSYEGAFKNMEPEKCDEMDFFPINDLPEKTIPPFRHAVECVVKGIRYSEWGWNRQ